MKKFMLASIALMVALWSVVIMADPVVSANRTWRGKNGLPTYRVLRITVLDTVDGNTIGPVETIRLPCNGILKGITLRCNGSDDFDVILGVTSGISFNDTSGNYGKIFDKKNINLAMAWEFLDAPIGMGVETKYPENNLYIRFKTNSANQLSLVSILLWIEEGDWRTR